MVQQMLTTKTLPSTDEKTLDKATDILRSGGLVVLPTDTVYGLVSHAYLPGAVEQIYRVKERPKDMAIPLLLADPDQVHDVASHVPPGAYRLMEAFWPGGLTFVLSKDPRVPDVVTAGGATVALRMPDHPFVLALIRALGAPLAATSANLSKHAPATTARDALRELGGRVALIVDGGACPGGVPSTVLDLTVDPPRILRAGAIALEEVWRVLR